MSDDEGQDELQKKRRLPPTSDDALAERQTDGYVQGIIKESKRRVLAGLSAINPPEKATRPANGHVPEVPPTSPLEHQREKMTPEQRRRHDSYLQALPPSEDQSVAVAAARVIRLENEHRQSPELRGIRTAATNRDQDREIRAKEHGPVKGQGRSQAPSDADQIARSQDQQQKQAERQDSLRQHGTDAPQEKAQEMKTTKTQEQLRREYLKQFDATSEQKADIAQVQTQQMSRGRSR